MGKLLTHNEFIQRLDKINPNREYEIIGKYESFLKPLLIKGTYGYCNMIPSTLIGGANPDIRSAINKNEYFIKRSREIHRDKYDYSLVEYINKKSHVKIICEYHGIFEQMPDNHLMGKGCRKCSIERNSAKCRSNLIEFVKKSNEIHDNFYSYNKFIYVNSYTKGTIMCPVHDDFEQTPSGHIGGSRCIECSRSDWGFSRQKFINICKNGFAFVYIVKFTGNDEEFYKIGITSKDINIRFKDRKDVPYKYIIIKTKRDNSELIYNLEKQLLKKYKNYKYSPKVNFRGRTECFSLDLPVQEIIKTLKQYE